MLKLLQADQAQVVHRDLEPLVGRQSRLQLQPEQDVAHHVEPGEQGRFLEHDKALLARAGYALPVSGRGARIRGAGAVTPTPFWAHAMRADSGRPSSSMQFRTWTATSISVARRSSVRERSPSPITRLNRPMVASARARAL